ncbi:unnamed protein product [Trichobilharzia regenti]|nr:unnamed protein product [Trichobilharzia regenti]
MDNCHKYPIESIKSINETSVHTTKPVHITYSPSYQQGDKINSEYTNNLLNNSSISINHCKDNQLNNQSSSSSEFINQPIRINNLNSKSGHPTHNFVSNILQHTNNCRKSWNSSGSSNLGNWTTADSLTPLLQKFGKEGKVPTDWKKGYLVNLPKKADLGLCNRRHGIMLLSTPRKVLSRIILERMKNALDAELRHPPEEAKFRKSKSWAHRIATLRIVIKHETHGMEVKHHSTSTSSTLKRPSLDRVD